MAVLRGRQASTRWRDDEHLIRSCLDGDASAWETLVRRYQRLIYSVPVAFRMAPSDADEIFQTVTVRLFEKLRGLRKAGSLPAWLVTTTRRECLAFLKGSHRFDSIDDDSQGELPAPPENIDAALDSVVSEHTLSLAFERLGEPCHGLLSALYLEDPSPSYEELGKRLGRPVGSLGPTRARCLKKLKKLFLDLGGAPP